MSKKWRRPLFRVFHGFCFSLRSRAAKAARYESLKAFIRFSVPAAEAGWNVKGCALDNPGFVDSLCGLFRSELFEYLYGRLDQRIRKIEL